MKEENSMTATPVEPIVMRSSRVTVTLYCGDCYEVLPIEADAVVTDPPYGIGYDATHEKYKDGKSHGAIEWDSVAFNPEPILRLNKPTVLWGGNCFASRLPDYPGWLSWVKIDRNGTKIRQAEMELAWTNFVTRSQSFRYTWIGAGMEGETNRVNGGTVHPTQKPVPLMDWCIGLAGIESHQVVLDPFMGSGTTGVACIRRGCSVIGVEKDERYFEIAVERIRRELVQ